MSLLAHRNVELPLSKFPTSIEGGLCQGKCLMKTKICYGITLMHCKEKKRGEISKYMKLTIIFIEKVVQEREMRCRTIIS